MIYIMFNFGHGNMSIMTLSSVSHAKIFQTGRSRTEANDPDLSNKGLTDEMVPRDEGKMEAGCGMQNLRGGMLDNNTLAGARFAHFDRRGGKIEGHTSSLTKMSV